MITSDLTGLEGVLTALYPITCSKITCGVHVGVGWWPTVIFACKELEELYFHDVGIRVVQVKEKFGGLRLYIDTGAENAAGEPIETLDVYRNAAYKITAEAEAACWKICEDCGTTQDVTTAGRGWIRTQCKGCREDFQKRRADMEDALKWRTRHTLVVKWRRDLRIRRPAPGAGT